MKESLWKGWRKEQDIGNRMGMNTMVNSKKTKSMEKEFIDGQVDSNMTESLKMIREMEEEF